MRYALISKRYSERRSLNNSWIRIKVFFCVPFCLNLKNLNNRLILMSFAIYSSEINKPHLILIL